MNKILSVQTSKITQFKIFYESIIAQYMPVFWKYNQNMLPNLLRTT